MSEFWFYFDIGLRHVLDLSGYDHLLFLAMLAVPYTFKDWKTLVLLVTLFTLGHTMMLVLGVYGILNLNFEAVEFLIPLTIMVTALYNIFKQATKATKNNGNSFIAITTLLFGLIHGMGFYNFIKIDLTPQHEDKLMPLLGFAGGVEAAQIIIIIIVLLLSFGVERFTRLSRRDWVLVTSAFVAGVVLPLLISHKFW
ncbi:HupE/UreJ family protein [Flavobacterium rhizosphaerae]|uniref:HupE/UreJ family protein n=1 Tax=Flavobacterium rhizosphaerae TaxID=3163298 RepID=A0ABW8YZP8_9FLAO